MGTGLWLNKRSHIIWELYLFFFINYEFYIYFDFFHQICLCIGFDITVRLCCNDTEETVKFCPYNRGCFQDLFFLAKTTIGCNQILDTILQIFQCRCDYILSMEIKIIDMGHRHFSPKILPIVSEIAKYCL